MAAATAEAARLGIPLTLHAGTVPDGGQIPTLYCGCDSRGSQAGDTSHTPCRYCTLWGADTDPMAAATAEAARLWIPLNLHAGTVPDVGRYRTDPITASVEAARLGIPLPVHADIVLKSLKVLPTP
jgi:hypothetical protein